MENPNRVLGMLAGADLDREILYKWANSADRILAADSGANILHQAGMTPHSVIGDMDSISSHVLKTIPDQVYVPDQDTTDCDKLLAHATTEGHAAITLIGVEGDLPDHVLATLHSSARSALDVKLAYRRGVGWIVKPGRSRVVRTQVGRRVSLMPLDRSQGVCLSGTKWPLRNAKLSLQEGVSISNQAEVEEVVVTLEEGAALLFVEVPGEELPLW